MSTTRLCENCGNSIPSRAPGGLCPKCLLSEAVEAPPGVGDDQVMPSLEETASPPIGKASVPRFGDYELLNKIAEGGMGVVYRARQLSLNRIVALKMIQPGRVGSPAMVLRFRSEAEAAASLHHPNIVAIHETGEYGGQHFFSMDFIQGQNLAETVREGPLPAARAAQLLEKIAVAVRYAHRQGILHRDLKPSNVILDETGEPHVTDFGLARRLGSASTLTLTGQVFGSPGFMPPEQASGRPGAVGVHSDVYGLGAILYHLLTGRAPFVAETVEATLTQVLGQDPVPPRLLNADTPRDLETICLKCLEKDPARRYPTAEAVADELGRFLRREPILAHPLGPAGKTWRWCRRKPMLAGLSASLLLALLLGAGGVLWQWQQTRTAHTAAQGREYAANIALAQSLIAGKQFDRARQILNERVREQDRSWEWGWLQRQCHQDLMTLSGAGEHFALFTPDSRWLVTGGANNVISIWDLKSGARIRSLTNKHAVTTGGAALSPDGRQLAAPGFYQANVWIWAVTTGCLLTNLPHPSGAWSASYSLDGKQLATTCWDGHVRLWDTQNWQMLRMSPGYGDELYCAEFSPDGRRVAYGGGYFKWGTSRNTSICIWDLESGESHRMEGSPHEQLVASLSWSPDGKRLASAAWDGQLKLWDPALGREQAAFETPPVKSALASLAFSPDGRSLGVAGGSFPLDLTRLQIYDCASGRVSRELLGHTRTGFRISFSPDGRYIATAAYDGDARIWSAEPRETYLSLVGHAQTVWTAAFSPDGKLLATGSLDQTARVWNPTNGALLQTIPVNFPVLSLAFNRRGDRLVTAGPESTACVWPVHPGTVLNDRPLQQLHGHTRAATVVAWSPDDRWIATGSKDNKVILWDAATGRPCRTWKSHNDWVLALAFDPKGELLASGGADRTVRLWDIQSAKPVRLLTKNLGTVISLAFSPDAKLLAMGTEQSGTRIWDTRTWRPLHSMVVPGSRSSAVAFSPDGRRLVTSPGYRQLYASAERQSRITLWDVASGQELLGLIAHTNAVYGVAFSPDGRQLVTTSGDNTARIWTAFPWKTEEYPVAAQDTLSSRIEAFKRQVGRDWTQAPPPSGRRTVRHYFGDLNLPPAGSKTQPFFPIPARSSEASRQQLDLASGYNVAVNESWEPVDDAYEVDRNLVALGAGLKTLGGVAFDVRGIIQLRRAAPDCEMWPERAAVTAAQKFQRLHVLHGTRWIVAEDMTLASLVLHYTDGTRHELPILYGHHVRVEDVNAPLQQGFGPDCSKALLAWTGPLPPEPGGWQPRLYLATFENPHPEREVREIEYISKVTQTAPFLVALTVE